MLDPRGPKYASLYPNDVHGFFHHADILLDLLDQYKPLVCVEVGTWQGASAIPIAKMISRWNGVLHCVDHWEGGTDFPPSLQALVSEAYPNFLSNIERYGVNNILIRKGESTEVAQSFEANSVDFVYIDASHDEESVRKDLDAWWPILAPGGFIAGDDYGDTSFPGVWSAWDAFAKGKAAGYQNGYGKLGLIWVIK